MIHNPKIIKLPKVEKFVESLEQKEQKKVDFNFKKTEAGLKGEWFKKMTGTDDIWEFRTFYNKKYIRILAFWDTKDKENPYIISTNGFIKKTNTSPKTEIDKSENIKNEYFQKLLI
ncbi:MAG: type II toxin-antitoxin system RelE/ParE family toxin [Cytophagales bacterium]|nr:type II toxin-antitoxin system RelE/ParE family toxin [Cytophagales bacterium]